MIHSLMWADAPMLDSPSVVWVKGVSAHSDEADPDHLMVCEVVNSSTIILQKQSQLHPLTSLGDWQNFSVARLLGEASYHRRIAGNIDEMIQKITAGKDGQAV